MTDVIAVGLALDINCLIAGVNATGVVVGVTLGEFEFEGDVALCGLPSC